MISLPFWAVKHEHRAPPRLSCVLDQFWMSVPSSAPRGGGASEAQVLSSSGRLLSLDATTLGQHGLDVRPHRGLILTVLGRRGRAGLAVLVEEVKAAAALATAVLRTVESLEHVLATRLLGPPSEVLHAAGEPADGSRHAVPRRAVQ